MVLTVTETEEVGWPKLCSTEVVAVFHMGKSCRDKLSEQEKTLKDVEGSWEQEKLDLKVHDRSPSSFWWVLVRLQIYEWMV